MSQTLQDILNTIQWEDFDYKVPNDDPDTVLEGEIYEHLDHEGDINVNLDRRVHIESGRDERSNFDLNMGHSSSRITNRRTLETAKSTLTSMSVPSTAYSTYSYMNDLESEYERAINEFDRIENASMDLNSDDEIDEANESAEMDEENGLHCEERKLNNHDTTKKRKFNHIDDSNESLLNDSIEMDTFDDVKLTEEQLFYLYLDKGEIDAFQESIQNFKQELESIDFEKKKQEVEHLRNEIRSMERLEEDIMNPSNSVQDDHDTIQAHDDHPIEFDKDSTAEGEKSNLIDEEEFIRLKEEHYKTFRTQLEDDENPLEELLKSVNNISFIQEGASSTNISVNNSTDIESSIRESNDAKLSLSSSINLLRESVQEATILTDLKLERQKHKEKLRKQRLENRRRIEKLRKEREEMETKAIQEEQERVAREKRREEEFRKQQEERQRQLAVWNMQREEQLMRDYLFEQEQKRLEDERIAKELEEKRRIEWEKEQERIRQIELQKAEERRKRIEQEKEERERIAREKYEHELQLAKQREKEEKRKKKLLERQRLELLRKRKKENQKNVLLRIKKKRMQCRKDIMQLASKIYRKLPLLSSNENKNKESFVSFLHHWRSIQKTMQSSKLPINLSLYKTPKLSESGDVILDDELIEVLSGDFSEIEVDEQRKKTFVNLILSVENITAIGVINRNEYKSVRSLVLDENSLQTLRGVEQLINIQYLSVRLNDLRSLEGLSNLNDLMELNIETNQLENLYGISECCHLRLLNASHNRLQSIDHIAQCKHIAVLKLYRNQLNHLNPVAYLENLLELDAGRNKLKTLPTDTLVFCHLLQKLVLYENELEEIPLTRSNILLKQLFLNGNQIKDAKMNSSFHPMLEYLNLSDNQIESLPPFQNFFMLKNLNISFNSLISLEELETAFRNSQIENLKSNDNPVCLLPGYREVLIAIMPKLKTLDDDVVTDCERNEVEFYCTMRSRQRLSNFWNYIEYMKCSNPFALMRKIRDNRTNWCTLFREAETMESESDKASIAYKRMCHEQNAEYIAFNSYYKKKLYIPLNKKTDQEKHAETLRLKMEYYNRWQSLAQRHYENHCNFDAQSQDIVVVHEPFYAQKSAASKIQRAFRRYRIIIREKSAIKIQAFIRGCLCRIRILPWMIKELKKRHRAAITIQTLWRGFRVRNILWKAKQVDPWIENNLDDLEQVNLDEFNFDPNLLGTYELKAELPPERTIPQTLVASKVFSQSSSSIPSRQVEELNLLTDKFTDKINDKILPNENPSTVPSIYQKQFHSSIMKQRVNALSRVGKSGSTTKLHTMDQLDKGKMYTEKESWSSQPNTSQEDRSPISRPTDFDFVQPRYQHLPPTSIDEDYLQENGPDTADYIENEGDYHNSVTDSSKKSKRSKLEKEKEEWHFKNENTASAWEKWAKKRKKLKQNALKSKKSDPMTRLKTIQKKTQPLSSTHLSTKRSQDHLFSRSKDTVHVQSSWNHADNDLEVESISSQDFDTANRTLRRPIRQNTLQFQNSRK